jgi:hypothetical protein
MNNNELSSFFFLLNDVERYKNGTRLVKWMDEW